ncbi:MULTISPECIES: anti-sigma factor RsbA family regulatory protein [Nocardiopsis]|uniref:Anti-sigma regulatory factor (Ser/Thr protein kinase) n=1 Tax=Nocardiopsis sinuspersici TaxID=501010 RepID=A0A1V3C820_9ACTN|nr:MULTISPECIES: anti-sigma factor RsbA family regulatory protein [Nocardiopsis]NYH53474.1 anti-sigma regulatory factor (Ser/Thr protein kinase) [Nocardiopsis sinuspersici]OOC56798.1 serine/threonine protein kinase [Nocardiopsis sinuspersici]
MTFEHQGLLFRREQQFHEVARERLRSAVRENARAVLAVTGERAEALTSALSPTERERVHVLDRDGLYDAPGRTLAALHRLALTHDPVPVVVVAEPPLPSASGTELREWHRLESVLCTALAPQRIRLLCAHDVRTLAPRTRSAVLATHPVLTEPWGTRSNPAYLGTAAFGARPVAPDPLPVTGPVHRLEIGLSLPRLRGELVALGADVGFPPERIDSLVVAVNELAANVLEHGAGKGTVQVWRGPGRWVCDVFDERGGLYDPLAGYRPADGVRPRGYGLWITRQTCDFLEISGTGEGSLVRLHFVDRAREAGFAEEAGTRAPLRP